jgi:hypothetical protein
MQVRMQVMGDDDGYSYEEYTRWIHVMSLLVTCDALYGAGSFVGSHF